MRQVSDEKFEALRNTIALSVKIYQQSKESEASNTATGQFHYAVAMGALMAVGTLFGADAANEITEWLATTEWPYPTELPLGLQDMAKPEAIEFFKTYNAPPIERPPDN
jgi:hypothetical protein